MRENKEGLWIVDGVGLSDKSSCDGCLYGGVEGGGGWLEMNGDEIESI